MVLTSSGLKDGQTDARQEYPFLFFSGPRTFPAQQQVFTQAIYLLVRMSREFLRIENRDPVIEYVERYRVVTKSVNGVRVALISSSNPTAIGSLGNRNLFV
jgi:hypothetical protein